jgi:methylated-DNA-protein-cysteine methyltransferase-like protein
MKRFHAAVYRLVERIPRGQVGTYGQIAALLGYPRAARAVGQAMKHAPSHLPWHRVVNAQGGISRRANVGGMLTQRVMLEQEGVVARRGRIRLREHRWTGPRRGRPLAIAALERL